MSLHCYSRCWLHLIWGTDGRERLLNKDAAARVPLPNRIRRNERHLHEDQLCERGSCSCTDWSADRPLDRGSRAITQGKFFALDQCERYHNGEIRVGARLMGPSPYRNPRWTRLWRTSQDSSNIIGFARLQRNSRNSSSATVSTGRRRKAVETALLADAWRPPAWRPVLMGPPWHYARGLNFSTGRGN